MHLPRFITTVLFNIALVNVVNGYYSSGWSPAGTDDAAEPVPIPSLSGEAPAATATSTGFSFDWTTLLTQGPIGEAFKLAGVNITERLEAAKKKAEQVPFDTRIPLITDDNYESLVKEDADKEDTWFIVVTLANSQDPMSKLVDQTFDDAYDLSQDLHHIKWGRVDYMAVTRVTTEWMVWKAPVLVIARKAGTELRFLYPSQVSLDAPKLYKFLKNEEWVDVPVWDSAFAPGGKYEPVVKSFAKFAESSYGIFSRIPKWLFLIISGSMASFVISLMHGSSKPSATKASATIADNQANGKATIVEGDGSPAEKKTRSKRTSVKKANEGHPDLATSMTASMLSEGGMTSSMVSESEGLASDGGKRPGGGARRRSTRTKVKK